MPRLASNRVGIQVTQQDDVMVSNETTVHSQIKTSESLLTLEAAKAQRQKERLRKKKAERRAQAKQRLADKARRQEEREQHEVEKMTKEDFSISWKFEEEYSVQPTSTTIELLPKSSQNSHSYSPDAAALTIQKALKRQLRKCQWIFRHSPRIFVEETNMMMTLDESNTIFTLDEMLQVVPPLDLPQLKPCVSPRSVNSCCSCSDEGSYPCSCSSYSCSCSCSSSSSESFHIESEEIARIERHGIEKTLTVDDHLMAVKIQARIRGNQGRIKALRQSLALDQQLKHDAMIELQEAAVVKIQTRARHMLKRKKREKIRGDQKNVESLTSEPGVYATCTDIGMWPKELDLEALEATYDIEEMNFTGNEQHVRVFCGTWNMHAKKPRDDLRHWIRWHKYHIVAVGSEECIHSIAKSVVFTSKKSWENKLKETVGPNYVLVASHALTAIHNVVFVHTSLVPLLSNIQSDAVATGLGNQLGNKGGVGIAFSLGATTFAFVNCHFDAHQGNVAKRNGNFHRINYELKLSPRTLSNTLDEGTISPLSNIKSGSQGLGRTSVNRFSLPTVTGSNFSSSRRAVSELFDRVFWYGDLNYRINGTRRMVDTLLLQNQYDVLYANDQLQREMKAGHVFPHFQEGPLHFRPTYKFDKRSDVYDSSSKQRIPSWTDRVLYLSNQKEHDIQVLSYRSEPNFRTSDHRPVCATFQVSFHKTEEFMSSQRDENLAISQTCILQ